MHVCAKLGANFTIANPSGYDMPTASIAEGRKYSVESGSEITLLNDPYEAVIDADVIYTDTWTSMGQEEETARREAVFPPYQVNEKMVQEAHKHVIVLHCLPAHRNHEITDAVADGPHSRLFPQAHNRMHAQKAILVKLLS
jgi:ornithine carbamoyltransferase